MDASNVFGIPVTQGSRLQRAEMAFNNQKEGEKYNDAVAFVKNQHKDNGNGVSTLCIFYNATGEELNYVFEKSTYGNIYESCPKKVQNGQWGAFLHVMKASQTTGSVGFAVYRGKKNDTDHCRLLFGWDNPCANNNHTFCAVFDDVDEDYKDVYNKMEVCGNHHFVKKLGMHITTAIEEGISPLYKAIISLEH